MHVVPHLLTDVRGWLARVQYRKVQRQINARKWEAACKIQRAVKGFLARKRYSEDMARSVRASVKIQSFYRGYLARKRFNEKLQSAEIVHRKHDKQIIKLQSAVRGYLARKQYKVILNDLNNKKWDASILLQRWFRMWKKKSLYQQVLLYKSQQETWGIFFMQQVDNFGDQFYNQMVKLDTPASPDLTTPSASIPPSIMKDGNEVTLSEERLKQIQKADQIKEPQEPEDIDYYNSVTEDEGSRRRGKKTGESKQLTSSSDIDYYSSLSDDLPSSLSENDFVMPNGYEELSEPGKLSPRQQSPRQSNIDVDDEPLYASVDKSKKKSVRPNRFSDYSSPTQSLTNGDSGSLHGFGYHGDNSRTSSVEKEGSVNDVPNQIQVQADINHNPAMDRHNSHETGEAIIPDNFSHMEVIHV